MPETMNWSFSIEAVQGPRISGSDALQVDAYDKVSVELDAGATNVNVQIQPADAAGRVQLLVIRSSAYDPAITFSADAGATSFALDGPVVLVGNGPVTLLAVAPQTLRLANGTADGITVDVLVGRDSAP
jgi:hypothetical protein